MKTPYLTTVLAACAVVVSLAALARSFSGTPVKLAPVEEPQLKSIQSQVDALAERASDLSLQVNRGESQGERLSLDGIEEVPQPESAATALSQSDRQLEALLAQLENLERVAAALSNGESIARSTEEQKLEREALQTEAIESYRSRAADPDSSVEDRIAALDVLRRFPAESGARDDSTVASALEMFDEVEDPKMRADVLRGLDGVQSDRLSQRLVQVISNDGSNAVRAEAIETLGPMASSDESLRSLLLEISKNDASSAVRRQADETLEEIHEGG